jgi:hypothetical protein
VYHAAKKCAECGENAFPLAAGKASGQHIEHSGAGRYREQNRGGEKQKHSRGIEHDGGLYDRESLLQPSFELLERVDAGQVEAAVCAGDIEKNRIHTGVAGSQIVYGIDVANVEAFVGARFHRCESGVKNFPARLLDADDAGIGDAFEAVGDTAAGKDALDAAVGVGDDGDAKVLSDPAEGFAGARRNLVPVGRVLRVLDEGVAEGDVFAELLEQVSVKRPPEALIDAAALHALIEFFLGSALEGLPLFEGGMTVDRDGSEHLDPVGEEKSVADIEENYAALWHGSILLKATFLLHC